MARNHPPGRTNGSKNNGNGAKKPQRRRGRPNGNSGTSASRNVGAFLLPHHTERRLTYLEAKFINIFIQDPSRPTNEIAIEAGYSEKIARQVGGNILRREHVIAEIKDQMAAFVDANRLSINRLIRHLIALSEVDKRDLFRSDGSLKPITELTKEQAALVKGFTVEELWDNPNGRKRTQTGELKKVVLTDHLKPVEMLAKYLRAYVDTVRVEARIEEHQHQHQHLHFDVTLISDKDLPILHAIAQRVEQEKLRRAQVVEGELVQ